MKKEKKEKVVINLSLFVFRIISIILIVMSCSYIFNWYSENKKNNDILNDLLSNVQTVRESKIEKQDTIKKIEIDFENLKTKNSDTIGWIKIDKTSVNYPIVKTKDNSYYLTHSFDKTKNSAGWIFADYRCNSDFSSKNTVIYGHSRKNGSMFGTLKNMLKPDWYKSNSYINISTSKKDNTYLIFSMYTIEAETYYTTTEFSSDDKYESFLKTLTKRSIHNFNIDVNKDDKIITLSTCSGISNNRIVVHAKLVK